MVEAEIAQEKRRQEERARILARIAADRLAEETRKAEARAKAALENPSGETPAAEEEKDPTAAGTPAPEVAPEDWNWEPLPESDHSRRRRLAEEQQEQTDQQLEERSFGQFSALLQAMEGASHRRRGPRRRLAPALRRSLQQLRQRRAALRASLGELTELLRPLLQPQPKSTPAQDRQRRHRLRWLLRRWQPLRQRLVRQLRQWRRLLRLERRLEALRHPLLRARARRKTTAAALQLPPLDNRPLGKPLDQLRLPRLTPAQRRHRWREFFRAPAEDGFASFQPFSRHLKRGVFS